ncbi:MAG: hypothetical protein OXH05_04680 [Acidobacteria bacterium]|nr:hypothetical protein [Acidobacteriota bacterium]MDE0248100.1 hypothetical protein [Gammaproteobacteria bacterium]
MAYTIDTAAATDRLTAAGVDKELARAIVTVIAEAKQANTNLVTKSDLTVAIAALEIRLLKWGVGLLAALFVALRLTG